MRGCFSVSLIRYALIFSHGCRLWIDVAWEKAVYFKENRMEKAVVLYCKQLGIDYRKLTREEFRRIFKKSKLFGGGGRKNNR